jgi:stress response protein SCP2
VAQDVLSKGANISLLHRSVVDECRLHAVVRWSDPGVAADVDVAALLLGPDGRVRSDEDFVFYNAPMGGDGAVRLLGKRSQEAASEDRVSVDLEALPTEIRTVVIVASLDTTDGVGFGDIPDLALDLVDRAGESRVRFDVADAGPETAMVLGELYLRGDDWKFRAVGQGWESGLASLARDYGIDVADPADDPTGVDGSSFDDDPVDAEPVELADAQIVDGGVAADSAVGADLVALPLPAGAGEHTTGIPTHEPVPNEAVVAEPVARRGSGSRARPGVRTRKRRATAATLPPLTLAVDPSWQPARLFSVTGVGNAEEQERRATSTLLSMMMAVRDFGRALVARFGGPAGAIETYLEVPLISLSTAPPTAATPSRTPRSPATSAGTTAEPSPRSTLPTDSPDPNLDRLSDQGCMKATNHRDGLAHQPLHV